MQEEGDDDDIDTASVSLDSVSTADEYKWASTFMSQ